MSEWKTVRLGDVCEILDSKRVPITAHERKNGSYPYYGANGIQDYVADYIFDDELVLLAEDGGNFGSKEKPIAYRVSGKCWVNNHAHVLKPKECLDVDYLCDSIKFYDVSTIVNGATRQKLTQSAMVEMKIFLPPLETQKQIAKQLNKCTTLLAKHKQMLETYDTLIKSRFIEMFGTENDFSKWNCCFVEDVADVTVGVVIKPTQYYCEKGIPAFRSLNIGEMKVNDSDWVYFTEEGNEKNRKSILKENDVLVVRSGAPGKSCVITKKYEGYNVVDAIIAHPNLEKVNPVFLCMFTNMPHGMNQIKAKTGGAAQQHFNVGGYNSLKIILPPLSLQNNFATFVQQIDKSKFEIANSLKRLYNKGMLS